MHSYAQKGSYLLLDEEKNKEIGPHNQKNLKAWIELEESDDASDMEQNEDPRKGNTSDSSDGESLFITQSNFLNTGNEDEDEGEDELLESGMDDPVIPETQLSSPSHGENTDENGNNATPSNLQKELRKTRKRKMRHNSVFQYY